MSKHRGVRLKKRTRPNGTVRWRAHYRDPFTGQERAVTLEPQLSTTAKAREDFCINLAMWMERKRAEMTELRRCLRHPDNHEDWGMVTYVVSALDTGLVKIGKSTCWPRRLSQLRTSSPCGLEVSAVLDGVWWEGHLHDKFFDHRKHGEWFEAAPVLSFLAPHIAWVEERGACDSGSVLQRSVEMHRQRYSLGEAAE